MEDAGVRQPDEQRHFNASWELACSILDYFDGYRLGSIAPIAAEIQKAMDRACADGRAIGRTHE